MAAYYPRKIVTIKDVKTEFGPELQTWDPQEEMRFEYIEEYVICAHPGFRSLLTIDEQTQGAWKE